MRFTSQSKTLAMLVSSVVLMTACASKVPLEDKAKIEEKPVATTQTRLTQMQLKQLILVLSIL
jgi:outer membrane PBP1 activator LpoA protein